jgi:ankyrin repeat protein
MNKQINTTKNINKKDSEEILSLTKENPQIGKLFIRFFINENIRITGGNNYSDSLEQLYEYIKTHVQQLRNYLPKNIIDYESFEELVDDITLMQDKVTVKKKFIDWLPGRLRREININTMDNEKISIVLQYLQVPRMLFRHPKLSKNIEDHLKYIEHRLEEITKQDKQSLYNELISSDKGNEDVQLIYNNDNILVFRVISPFFIKKYGSQRWCIVYAAEIYLTDYVNPGIGNTQYLIFNFNQAIENPGFKHGITINSVGYPIEGGCQNNYNEEVSLIKLIKKLKLPIDLIREYEYDPKTIKRFRKLVRLFRGEDVKSLSVKAFNKIKEFALINTNIFTYSVENKKIFDLFMANGVDVNNKNYYGFTALHNAVMCGNTDVVRILIDNNADVNVLDNDHIKFPLLSAVLRDDKEITNILLENGADVNLINKIGDSPLHGAVLRNNKEITNILLEKGADVNSINNIGDTPLIIAVKNQNYDLVQRLTLAGADLYVQNKENETALSIAARLGNVDIVNHIINKSISEKKQKKFSDDKALLNSIAYGKKELVSLFLELRIGINTRDDNGDTPLFLAAKAGNIELVKSLIEKGADISICNDDGKSVLMTAIGEGRMQIARMLIEFANAPLLNVVDREDRTALEMTINDDIDSLSKLLIIKGADFSVKTSNGDDTLLSLASFNENLKMVKFIISKYKETGIEFNFPEMALLYSIKSNNCEITKLLIRNSIGLNARDENGNTPLIISVKKGNMEIFKLLLKKSKNIDLNAKNRYEESALGLAARINNAEMVQSLLKKRKIEINTFDIYNCSPLGYAIKKNNVKMVKVLIERKAGVSVVCSYNNQSVDAYKLAAIFESKKVLKLLIDSNIIDFNRKKKNVIFLPA